jgi:hypothetical protein
VRHPPPRIHHNAYRTGAANAADSELWIIRTGGLGPDNDGVNQGSQTMEMRQRSRAVDVARAAGRSCHSAVERLTDLASNHKIIDFPDAQGPKKFFPRGRQWRSERAKQVRHMRPSLFAILPLPKWQYLI